MIQITCRFVGRDALVIRTDMLPIDQAQALKLAEAMADALIAHAKFLKKFYVKVPRETITGTVLYVMQPSTNAFKPQGGELVCIFSFEEV